MDEPHKTYRSGEQISGQIILILGKNISNILIKLALVGVIKIHSSSPLRSDKKEYLFNHSIILYGETENNELALTKGEHRFPFIVKLPKKNVHTSISFEKGEIKYSIKSDISDKSAVNDRLWTSEMLLNIVKPINLCLLPEAKPKTLTFRRTKRRMRHVASPTSSINSTESLELQQQTNNNVDGSPSPKSSSDSSDVIKICMEIPSVGYLKGESISVKVSIEHYKQISNVNGIFITLIRVCALDMGEDHEHQSFRKDLAQSIVPLIIDPSSKPPYNVSTSLRVPLDSFPTIVTNLVSFQYYIEVLINMSKSSRFQGPLKTKGLVDDEIIQRGSRDNIYNVDKLKQMKNVLTLTSEIVIGTERKPISKLKTRHRSHRHQHGSANSPVNVASSSFAISCSSSCASSTVTSPSSMSSSRDHNTPNTEHHQSTSVDELMIPAVPSPPAITSPVSAGEEKELIRLREQALMPSQPPPSSPSPPGSTDGSGSRYISGYSMETEESESIDLPAYSEVASIRQQIELADQQLVQNENRRISDHSIETITTPEHD
ncbi:hypothetical protein FOA43_004321 [Brettanomyces nanus]|uniref:pH-response regulator protein palF/RIM8 n=1 Tax=Eeniella nana TaxID=13502 RepID=A0A875RXK2_EENNA|nr:uncharacterized protein FOA43_004321 [Brettanomyces nanus]QPG76927.1 hypothetical protein FOA43_004321 [Brettanomyces nanus]